MRTVLARATVLVMAAAACVAGAACSSGPTPPHGAPVLEKVYWTAGGTRYLVWSLDVDPALVSPVPPYASEVDFVFDRRLDGAMIEDVVTVNGVMMTVPKTPPPVQASWDDMTTMAGHPDFGLVVSYDSTPKYGGQSSFVFARPDPPGFPSSDTVKFMLLPSRLTSPYDEPAQLRDNPIPVKTSAFSVSIDVATEAVAPTLQVPLAFNNRLPAPPATSPFIHVQMNGAEVPYKILGDANVLSRWFLAPAECLGGAWPAGATLKVTVDAAFADAFGGKLAQATTATFTTSAAGGAPATCPVADGGAPDAPASEGGADGPSDGGVDAAVDAAVDGGVDAASDAPVETPSDAGDETAGDASVDAAADGSPEAG
jgi:hypothetical protein